MRKLLIGLLLVAAACRTKTVELPSPATSAAVGPRPALDAFLNAVRTQDLQAMSEAWGNKDGPVRDSKVMTRDDMEKRELILMRCFRHDKYRILAESPAADAERIMQVELRRGTQTRTTNFYTAKGADRWYVRSGDLEPVRDFCASNR